MASNFMLKPKHYAILNFAGVQVNPYSRSTDEGNLRQKLCEGFYFFNNKLKYWVSSNGNDCYELYARMLRIMGSEDPLCWKWDTVGDPQIEVAESVNVRWLEARIKFSSVNLQQNTNYKVSFEVKLTKREMVGCPLTVKLVLPDGTKIENPRKVIDVDKWTELLAGEFYTSHNTVGTLDISLQQVDSHWKRGIVIKSVKIVALN